MAKTAAERYAVLEPKRIDYLERARKCSELTLPHLFPKDGATSSTQFVTPYQSLGARGVNNLGSKLLLSLLPPNSPFFKQTIAEKELDELKAMGAQAADLRTEIEAGLEKVVKRFMGWVEASAIRPSIDEAMKQLIVGGNVLIHVDVIHGVKIHRLDTFVVRRAPDGTVLEIIIKEPTDRDSLPENARALLREVPKDEVTVPAPIFLYTSITLRDGKYDVFQEIEAKVIPESKGSYTKDANRFIPLRLTKVAGESYGRSYIEQYYGDLKSLEGLTKAVVLSSQVTAKAVVLVRPGGVTNAKTLAKAETGDVVTGSLDDVGMLQFDKWADLRVAFETIKDITQRLGFAFLLNTAIQRPGDRVTAEEIRYMARELDDALGGLYATLSQDFQLPFLKAGMAELTTSAAGKFELPTLPEQITPVLVTGIEALGRGHDLQKLEMWVQGMVALGEPGMRKINVDTIGKRRALALGIDTEGLMRTEEELAEEMQMAQQQQMIEKLGPQAINQMGQMAQSQEETPTDG